LLSAGTFRVKFAPKLKNIYFAKLQGFSSSRKTYQKYDYTCDSSSSNLNEDIAVLLHQIQNDVINRF